MTYFEDSHLTILEGDAASVLATLEPESVHCVVTSPPYWGLRDYGTASWEGGDPTCHHVAVDTQRTAWANEVSGPNGRGKNLAETHWKPKEVGGRCGTCGAHRIDSQLGLEPTPEAYVEALVRVFREVRRVLRSDGTVWLNLGDSYASSPPGNLDYAASMAKSSGLAGAKSPRYQQTLTVVGGLKPKDLVGIPWRVAFALQADGWYLRSDIIWSKPNPMPESVTDRPTKSHEYLFLLSKSARYFFDADAVREPSTSPEQEAHNQRYAKPYAVYDDRAGDTGQPGNVNSVGIHARPGPGGRNIRSVWTVATQPYPGAHFATFPEALVEPCVKAGTSERGVCPECGAPWTRVVEKSHVQPMDYDGKNAGQDPQHSARRMLANVRARREAGEPHDQPFPTPQTTGWRTSCAHTGDPVPAVVMDCFAGTGTVGLVAQRLSRRAVLIDLNAEYLGQCLSRNRQVPLGLGA